MTENDDRHDDPLGQPPEPPEPFDPSTREFEPVRHPPFEAGSPLEDAIPLDEAAVYETEVEEERPTRPRRPAVSMDTETFMAIPAPAPRTTFEPPEFERKEGRIGLSTAFFSAATALSRIAGLVREIVAASYFGIRGPMSAFTIAFQIPNLVRSLFADAAIQAAFVPVFLEKLEAGDRREAFRLASQLIYLMVMVLGARTAIFVLAAPVLVPIFAPGFEGELLDLTVTLSQILFPILILLGVTGIIVGILNSDDRFAAFAISPFFWNVAIIAVLVALAPQFSEQDQIYAYAIGVLVGTVIQLAIPAWDLRHTVFGGQGRFRMDWRVPRPGEISPDVRQVLILMLPVTISLGLINFNLVINSFFGTLVSDEAPAAIDKAFRIYIDRKSTR